MANVRRTRIKPRSIVAATSVMIFFLALFMFAENTPRVGFTISDEQDFFESIDTGTDLQDSMPEHTTPAQYRLTRAGFQTRVFIESFNAIFGSWLVIGLLLSVIAGIVANHEYRK